MSEFEPHEAEPLAPGERHRLDYTATLGRIRSDLVRLGAMVSETIGKATEALLSKDLRMAQELIDGDDVIDRFSLEIEEQCYQVLALESPMAGDLRFVVSTLRLVPELERSADLMVNICKAARRLYDVDFDPTIRRLIEAMSVEAAFLVRHAIDAYVESDAALAAALDDVDDRLDELHVDFIQAIFTTHNSANTSLQSAVQLALIGRYYERIGDHAVNIGERVVYMVTGWLPEHNATARLQLREQLGNKPGTDQPE